MQHCYTQNMNVGNKFGNFLWIILILIHVAMAGCAGAGAKSVPIWLDQSEISPQMGWWRVAFKINWPPETTPHWYMDLLLAHQIIYPVLKDHGNKIALWRFHRRAGKDAAGHQFSFIFYCKPKTAEMINSQINSRDLLTSLEQSGELMHIHFQPTDKIKKTAIEATSDSNWSIAMQKAWPYYIMGVSRMWLLLVDHFALDIHPPGTNSVKDLIDFYKKANTKMIAVWQDEGRHALLHHLNALFGYHPLNLKLRF